MKKFRAYYYIPKLDKEYECDVFAMSIKQAYEMYRSSFMNLIKVVEIGTV